MEHSKWNRKLSGEEAIVEALDSEGIRIIYGLPGISNLSIYDALYLKKKI
jgi:thiamine pyrophosphate-dependent acetolactate synthase large subunit-like protein